MPEPSPTSSDQSLRGRSVVIAGAGAFGSAVALALARAGAAVTVVDPATRANNASGVAAGMLAPAFEALLDAPVAGRFELLRTARSLWPAFLDEAADTTPILRRTGALWIDRPGELGMAEAHASGLAAMGARVERRASGVFTPEDWMIDPEPALALIHARIEGLNGRIVEGRVVGFDDAQVRLASGVTLRADQMVVATGAEAAGLAPELRLLSPIKGQILHYLGSDPGRGGPIIRAEGSYAAPGRDGLKIGATMEAGLADRRIDPEAVARLHAFAVSLFPELEGAPFRALAGVRAASPDGLPLVGPSTEPGVMLAVGARRNGWLLAPLVAAMTAAYLAGDDPGPYARAFDPSRFGPG
jgi:glycine oxidase